MGAIFDELKAALHAVWMRRWIALAVAWGVCLAGWLVVSQMPNMYESRARIFVQLRQILPGADGSTPGTGVPVEVGVPVAVSVAVPVWSAAVVGVAVLVDVSVAVSVVVLVAVGVSVSGTGVSVGSCTRPHA